MSKSLNSDVVALDGNNPGDTQSSKPVEDGKVKDAQLIFHSVWHELEKEVGWKTSNFLLKSWLNGAPERVRGQTALSEFRDLTEKPIVVSELLQSQAKKN